MSYRKYIFYGAYMTCPYCGGKGKYRLWYWNTTPPIPVGGGDMECGICFKDSCSHHNFFPSDYFLTHPEAKDAEPQDDWEPMPDLPVTYIPDGFLTYNLAKPPYTAELLKWLQKFFPVEEIQRSADLYVVGQRTNGQIEWAQIDMEWNIREIKLQAHNINDGHRVDKVNGYFVGTRTMHRELVELGYLEESRASQCLFGEHLLSMYPERPVCIVESEKTAFVFSLILPEFIWVATGGKNFISKVKSIKHHLRGRNVIVFPDAGGYEEWSRKLESWGIDCMVSDRCESYPHNTDILDIYIKERHPADINTDKTINVLENLQLADQMTVSIEIVERWKKQLYCATTQKAMQEICSWETTPTAQPPEDNTIVALSPQLQLEEMIGNNPAIALLVDSLELEVLDDGFEPF